MLNEALSYPTEDDDWTRPFLIGSGLILASFFVGLTVIPLYGYYLRVIDAGRTGDRRLPEFDDWDELIVDGVKMFVVNFAYAGIPAFVFFFAGFLLFVGFGLGAASESGAVIVLALLVGGLVAVLAGVLWLVGTVTAPAALAHMRAEGEFSAAFHLRTIFSLVATKDYLVALLLALFVGGTIAMVGGFLSILLVGIPVVLFGGVVTFHLYGQGYQRAREEKLDTGAGQSETVVRETGEM